uniref:Uncharacterized protein n=1 Tax=Eptatretus burgeri TaxID=7764 RepID=A0A8C4QV91_EPTBU
MAKTLVPLWSWGVRVDISGVPSWLDKATLVLVSGSYCVLYNTLHSTQHFIPGICGRIWTKLGGQVGYICKRKN